MTYKVTFQFVGVEDSGSGSKVFEADRDSEAKEEASDFIEELRQRIVDRIPNPFWRPDIEMTGLLRVRQKEIVESVVI